MEFRWLEPEPTGGEPGTIFIQLYNIQQKFQDQRGDIEWRNIPIVKQNEI